MTGGRVMHRGSFKELMSSGIDFSSIVEEQNAKLEQEQPAEPEAPPIKQEEKKVESKKVIIFNFDKDLFSSEEKEGEW